MKLKYLIYTITLTSLTACSDFLEPKSQSKYIPKDANALQEMLIGEAYPQQGNTKFLAYLEILADDIDQNQVEGYEFPENEQGKMETFEVLYSWQPNMFEMQQKLGQEPSNTWGNLYEYILGANAALDYIDEVSGTETEKNYIKAQSYALRAFFYYMLVNQYGLPYNYDKESLGVPLKIDSKMRDEGEVLMKRNTVDECFDFIVSELKGAQNDGLLDDASTDKVSGYGRIDKAIAQAFIIEALTYRASWLFNGECNYYSDLANTDGTKLFPNKPDEATKRANWQKVINECNTFFSNYGSRYHLMYTNKDGVSVSGPDSEGFSPTESYRRAVRTLFSEMGNNKEMIFYRLDNAAGTMQYDRMPNRSGNTTNYRGGSLLGATQEMVDAYFMSNGESPISGYSADGVTPIINEKSDYVEEGVSTTEYKGTDGTLYAPTGTRMMYVNREPRFYVDITFSNSKWFDGTEGNYIVDFTYSGSCGKEQGSNDYTSTGYLVRKGMDSGDRNQNLVCVLLRLTNIYFDYIEALAHVSPTHEDIWTYMNMIRKRAGIPGYGETVNLPKPTTTEEVMELIRKEKRIELSFENCRYFDVRRWGLVNEYFNKAIHGMNVNYDGNEFFKRTEIVKRIFDRQYFFPIPQGEIDIDKNLVQNTGF